MDQVQLVTAFDIAEAGYKAWEFPAFGLLFMVVGLAAILIPKYLPALEQLMNPNGRSRKKAGKWFLVLWLSMAVLFTVLAFAWSYSAYRTDLSKYRAGDFKVVEGLVEDFQPMPWEGHQRESFTVKGVTFSYSDFEVTDGFNNTKSHGGPIDEGIFVRVSYVDNTILKLEVQASAMEGRKPNHSETFWDMMGSDARQAARSGPPDRSQTLMNYAMHALVVLIFAIAWWRRGRTLMAEHPEKRKGYRALVWAGVLWGWAPPFLAVLAYWGTNGGAPDGAHTIDGGVYAVSCVMVAGALAFWVFVRDGAETMAAHPGLVDYPWVVRLYSLGLVLGALVLSYSFWRG